jgi:hypothetical protein
MPTLVRFEREVHDRVWRGDVPTGRELVALMRDLFQEGYGDAIEADERVGIAWAQFGHLTVPFYTFQYAVGIAASAALTRRIVAGEAGAAEAYLGFLRAGASVPPELFARVGLDVTTPARSTRPSTWSRASWPGSRRSPRRGAVSEPACARRGARALVLAALGARRLGAASAQTLPDPAWPDLEPAFVEHVCPPPENPPVARTEAERARFEMRARYRTVMPAFYAKVGPWPTRCCSCRSRACGCRR